MSRRTMLEHDDWHAAPLTAVQDVAARDLEAGHVLFLPRLRFEVGPAGSICFSPDILAGAKNVSFDPLSGRLGGTSLTGDRAARLHDVLARFSRAATTLVGRLFPAFRGHLERGRASFRPAEIAGRATSWRKDDSRLHVDSFPATPVQGRRILRVFTNVNPAGRPRSWRIGDDFEPVAARFAARLHMPRAGSATMLRLLRMTKTRRSAYDALMLQLHDRMKEDADFQARSPQTAIDFPAGTTWIAFTDQLSHAATAGQYQLEQTLLVPIEAMREPARSPLRILERLKGRVLV